MLGTTILSILPLLALSVQQAVSDAAPSATLSSTSPSTPWETPLTITDSPSNYHQGSCDFFCEISIGAGVVGWFPYSEILTYTNATNFVTVHDGTTVASNLVYNSEPFSLPESVIQWLSEKGMPRFSTSGKTDWWTAFTGPVTASVYTTTDLEGSPLVTTVEAATGYNLMVGAGVVSEVELVVAPGSTVCTGISYGLDPFDDASSSELNSVFTGTGALQALGDPLFWSIMGVSDYLSCTQVGGGGDDIPQVPVDIVTHDTVVTLADMGDINDGPSPGSTGQADQPSLTMSSGSPSSSGDGNSSGDSGPTQSSSSPTRPSSSPTQQEDQPPLQVTPPSDDNNDENNSGNSDDDNDSADSGPSETDLESSSHTEPSTRVTITAASTNNQPQPSAATNDDNNNEDNDDGDDADAAPPAILTVGSQTYTAQSNGAFVIGSYTLGLTTQGTSPQGVAYTVDSTPVWIIPAGGSSGGSAVIVGGSLQDVNGAAGGTTASTANELSSSSSSSSITATLSSSGDDSSSITPTPAAPGPGPSQMPPIMTLGRSAYTARAYWGFIVDGTTLFAGGRSTFAGTDISLAPDGFEAVIDGSTQTLGSALATETGAASGTGTPGPTVGPAPPSTTGPGDLGGYINSAIGGAPSTAGAVGKREGAALGGVDRGLGAGVVAWIAWLVV